MNITRVLLCNPLYFQVNYVINPWMKIGSVDTQLALKQWKNLVRAYENHHIKVLFIKPQPDYPDMVFSADQAILINKNQLLLSKFKHPERQRETDYYLEWFEDRNFEIIKMEDDKDFFEGCGDCLYWKDDQYIMGHGFRNSENIEKKLKKITKKRFIPLNLIDERFYHLDTCLFIIDQNTAFYYSKAFDQKSLKLMKKLFPNLIEVVEKEALNFALNSLRHENTVFIQKGNPDTNQKIKSLNLKIVELDVSQFMKAGGGIHCLTQVIEFI